MAEDTRRTESFSDGIFAIAATLLVLNLRVPGSVPDGGLLTALLQIWPSYLAFAISFFALLITWLNHHYLMQLVRTKSRSFLVANGFVLFYVSFLPFPTAVLASHLAGPNERVAVAFYCGTIAFGSVTWNLVVAALEHDRLYLPEVDERAQTHIRRTMRIALLTHICATLLALVLPRIALALSVVLRLNLLRRHYAPTESLD